MDTLLHTPDGVRDIYNEECRRMTNLSDRLLKVLSLYGYQKIQTPSFEFFDIFNKERGTVSSRKMYKFFDREGNTLVLRPDITPSIARAVAKYFHDESIPIRFSYLGNTFINNSSLQGRLCETTQIGAELINAPGIEADAEMIALSVQTLLEAGLSEFQIDIGHAAFFKAIVSETELDADSVSELKELINLKNYFGVEAFIEGRGMTGESAELLKKLPELFGNADMIYKARELTSNPEALAVLYHLEKLYSLISSYGFAKYVTIDLGMLTEYDYYTGIIFRGFTYGTGDAIVKGGRYDKLICQFGKDAASIGFVIVLDELMLALYRQNIEVKESEKQTMVLYPEKYLEQAIAASSCLRSFSHNVCMVRKEEQTDIEDYKAYCGRFNIESILHITGSNNCDKIDISDGSIQNMPLPVFGKEIS